jgi:hypothetical protein
LGEAVLIFPAGAPEGLVYRDRAKALGLRVVGASSVDGDPAQAAYEDWETLPHVDDPAFDEALAAVVRRHEIAAVHAPHQAVWKRLSERLGRIAPGARLSGGAPLQDERAYRDLRERVEAVRTPPFWPARPGRKPLTPTERAGFARLADTVPGGCGEAKMLAVMEALRYAPGGDIVEIGSWSGRTASLFVLLAHHWDLGPVLCVDSWEAQAGLGGRRAAPSLDERETAEALRVFEINLAPLARGKLNYLRAASPDAAARYRPGLRVTTPAFGSTDYAGEIALLIVAGAAAAPVGPRDCALWTPRVAPGGWIIFSDYEWVLGDGPKRVADAFCAREGGRVAATFQAGTALFVQMKACARS